MDLHDQLPAGTYTVKLNENTGQFFLETIDNFEIKGKVYGDTVRNADRILGTFKDRPGSTGVMLTGEKGSGKTLLAKKISLQAIDEGMPTVVINDPWRGEQFNSFMQMIEQPTIVIFDEFEKVYDHDEQEKLLTLFDGVYPSKKMFIVTSNDKYRVNEHMRNRPGRMFYRLEYKGLSDDFITEYCEDNLTNKDHIDSVRKIAMIFSEFNFDILKAMVEEMNRYNETPQEVMRVLNAKPENDDATSYKITLFEHNVKVPEDRLTQSEWRGVPLSQKIRIPYRSSIPSKVGDPMAALMGDDDDDENWMWAEFSPNQITQIEASSGEFQFDNEKGEKLLLSRVKATTYDYNLLY